MASRHRNKQPVKAVLSVSNSKAAGIERNVLFLACLLPLLIPFGLTRNIGLQALVIIMTGALAYYALWLRHGEDGQISRRWILILGLYLASCLVNTVSHHSLVNILGSPLIRLGSLELIGCVGIGLCMRHIPPQKVIRWLYVSLLLLGLASLPYTLLKAHHLVRIGGLLHQPDFLAIAMAIGFLLGIELWQNTSKRSRWFVAWAQAYLLIVILMTQTRAAILGLFIIVILRLWLLPFTLRRKIIVTVIIMLTLTVGLLSVRHVTDGRLTDKTFATQSTSYRLALQKYGVKAVLHKPFVGYGTGRIDLALACSTLHDPALQHTCHTGYYFDSSHNIYLDRGLGLGWIGGLSFTVLVIGILWASLRQKSPSIFAFSGLLICLYYLTNVTGLEVEMLLWIMLGQCLPAATVKVAP